MIMHHGQMMEADSKAIGPATTKARAANLILCFGVTRSQRDVDRRSWRLGILVVSANISVT